MDEVVQKKQILNILKGISSTNNEAEKYEYLTRRNVSLLYFLILILMMDKLVLMEKK